MGYFHGLFFEKAYSIIISISRRRSGLTPFKSFVQSAILKSGWYSNSNFF
jgi:hypothetical protein